MFKHSSKLQALINANETEMAANLDESKQAVQVNAPTTQNSNNQSNQSNTGSGTQVNNTGSGSSNTNTGSGEQTVNSGSGDQTSTVNTNTGSGTQTNTTVTNTQTGDGTIVQPVNTGSGIQTTNVVTGTQNNNTVAGNQAVVNGNQTNNIPKTIPGDNNPNAPQSDGTTSFNQTIFEQKVTQSVLNWPAVSGATKYTIFSNNQEIQETTSTTVTIPVTSLNQKIAVVASNSTNSRLHPVQARKRH